MVLKGPPLGGYSNRPRMDDTDNQEDILQNESSLSDSRMKESDYRPVSALARGVQITEFAESRVNPTPLMLDEADILIEQYLSPGKLQMLTGADDLKCVESLELKVDTRETSLGNFGSLLPNLTELKLSGSCILSARDLGSSLHNLTILWLTRCGLEELDGISSMLSLKELFLEYNEISDLSPLSMLEELQILDLEGNNIEDVSQVQYLSLCPKLHKLALDGNPVCVMPTPTHDEPNYNYRETVQKYLPQLRVLDDEALGDESSSSIKHNVFDEDWAYLEELQKDAFLKEEYVDKDSSACGITEGDRPPSAALRPATSYRPGSALRPSSGFRPLTASRRISSMSADTASTSPHPPSTAANRPVSSDAVDGLEVASELTIGGVICGNPSKALRQRKNGGAGSKDEIQKGLSKLLQKGAVFNHSENAEDEPFRPEEEMNNIIEELQSWKVEHEKRMIEIRKTKEAQVLVVDHDEAEDVISLSGSENEFDDDLDLEKEMIEYRPPSSWHRHKADLRLHSKVESPEEDEQNQASGGDTAVTPKVRNVPKIPAQSKYAMLRGSVGTFDSKENGDNIRTSPEDTLERPSSSFSNMSGYQQSFMRSGGQGDSKSDLEISPRPRSRGQTDPEHLGPLRVPSPSSAHIMNTVRTKQIQSPPSPRAPRRLRVGPTGLPLSSQQPVIRNNITPSLSSRPGTNQQSRPPPSRGNIALLPSQPRIPRHLPEPPSLLPHPPPKH